MQDRLEELAGIFAVDVTGFCVMSNHLHVILRTRPDVVATLSDNEVAQRWWRLFPRRRDEDGLAAEPEPHELRMLQADEKALLEKRRRLASVSWFMRCISEPIARRANREDECRGRFWEGRFKCQALLDETAVLACSVYVDLNPIRAGIATTPETSQFTSAYERIAAMKDTPKPENIPPQERKSRESASPRPKLTDRRRLAPIVPSDGWLSPVELIERLARRKSTGSVGDVGASESRSDLATGFLSISQADYLRLLDWTGRQIRRDKRGAIPTELAPILERLQLNGETWLTTVREFGRTYHRAAGSEASMTQEATRAGRRWLAGVRHSRRMSKGQSPQAEA